MRRVIAVLDHATPDVEHQLMILAALDRRDEQNEALGQFGQAGYAGVAPTRQELGER